MNTMSTAQRLVLENRLGQRVRTFKLEADTMTLIYRLDTRRVEAHANLAVLDKKEIKYQVIKKINVAAMPKNGVMLTGLGRLRMATEQEIAVSPRHELAEENDDAQLKVLLKKTSIGHAAAVVLLIALSFLMSFLNQKPEQQLVTITIPMKETAKLQLRERVKVSEKKIVPRKTTIKKIAKKTVIKPVTRTQKFKKTIKTARVVQRRQPIVVRAAKPQNLQNVGALAALGGLKNGTRGYEGLDANSLKKIRSAGVGSGGGGMGSGSGGMTGVMPGSGLIAGSSGRGGRAQGAGGYGTRGAGGGRAGYGKISLVGNISGISLPMDEEATIEGGLDKDQIAAVINRNKGQIIYCYEQGLQNVPDLMGRVSVEFVISASGRISTAKVAQTSLGSKLVENCMIAKMKSWQFPKPVGSVNVDVLYPFELRRVSSR
jgi:hypothetical protein